MSSGKAVSKQEFTERTVTLADLLQTGAVEMTEVGLVIRDTNLDFDVYTELGAHLVGFHRSSCWWLGDWILFGDGAYGERLAQAVEVTRLAEGTLQNYASVCRRVARSRRKYGVPFSVHAEIAHLEPDDQKLWLAVASKEGLRMRDMRHAVKSVKDGLMTSEEAIASLHKPAEPGELLESNGGRTRAVSKVLDDIRSLGRAIIKQSQDDAGDGYVRVPRDLVARLASVLGEPGYE